ncbi:MAG: spore coat protein CotJB [Eubacteriales bacterium]|nr:spore coat protein CotJB [Eubacteriales bacterium]
MSRDQLLKELSAMDFYTVDLQLYLNTHPNDRDALQKYNAVASQAGALRQEYESMYGPLTSFRSTSKYPWQWTADPWPWQYEFNFKLAGDGE